MKTSTIIEKKPAVEKKSAPGIVQKRGSALTQILLACGILSSLYYAMMNIIVPGYFPGYSVASQTVSELSAIGAPSRPIWVSLAAFYSLLVLAFGWGTWRMATQNRRLRVVAVLMLLIGISGFFWPPMHLRGEPFTNTDMMHIVFAWVTVLFMIGMISFGAAAFGSRFLRFSVFTLGVILVFGTLTGISGPNIAANLPTPWIGVWERINIGAWLLWVIELAITLMKRKKKTMKTSGI
jgi:hypothetical protein